MHVNTDSPSGTIVAARGGNGKRGYLVERPEICWSYRRRRDRAFLDFLEALEAPIARLRQRGASAIVVAGMSRGGIAALAFWCASSGSRRHHRACPSRGTGAAGGCLPTDSEERRRGEGDGSRWTRQ